MPISTSEVNTAAYARNGGELRKLNYETTGGQVKLTEQNGVTQADAQAEFEAIHGLVGAAQSTADDALAKAEQAIDSIPDPYTLPVASTETLGGIKPDGVTVTVSPDGTASVPGSTPPDGTTVVSKDSKLVAMDVAINGDPSDLASVRGQIGAAKYLDWLQVNIDELYTQGRYRIYGHSDNLGGGLGTWPDNLGYGTCVFIVDGMHNCYIQRIIAIDGKQFIRYAPNNQTPYGNWSLILNENLIGDGINVGSNGVISVPEMQGATASEAGVAGLVPPAGAGVDNRFLSPFGDWRHGTTREILTADKTLYVRSDGNDSNDGSADDAEHAFLTIYGALNYAFRNIFRGGYLLIIQVGAGTFYLPYYLCGLPGIDFPHTFIRGSGKGVTNITSDPSIGEETLAIVRGGRVTFSDLTFVFHAQDGKRAIGFSAEAHGVVWIQSCDFDFSSSRDCVPLNLSTAGYARIEGICDLNLQSDAGVSSIMYASGCGGGRVSGKLTVHGVSNGVVTSTGNAQLYVNAKFFGDATGVRYRCLKGGIINTNGKGPDYIIGTEPGILEDDASFYF